MKNKKLTQKLVCAMVDNELALLDRHTVSENLTRSQIIEGLVDLASKMSVNIRTSKEKNELVKFVVNAVAKKEKA